MVYIDSSACKKKKKPTGEERTLPHSRSHILRNLKGKEA
jgi:hypothetical protein